MPVVETEESGFLLLDMVMAMSLLLILALLAWPSILSRSTAPLMAATALDTTALLRSNRAEAGRGGHPVSVTIDLNRREIGGDVGRTVTLASDLTVDLVTDRRCRIANGVFVVTFQPDGSSCGGVLTIAKGSVAWRVAINWMTGAVDAEAKSS